MQFVFRSHDNRGNLRGDNLMRFRNALFAALLAATALAALPQNAGAKDLLAVDFIAEPSSLDPHVQWNTDSFNVYRNIFDNLLTRDDKGKLPRKSQRSGNIYPIQK
ncbi:hypothetical protein HGG75_14465 [Ochrobactrum pseudogrignonense]|nr:hypothetical protein [Brucella pseudogrignonensis]